MESITIGQIAATLAMVVALVAGIQNLKKSFRTLIDSALKERFRDIDNRFDELKKNQEKIKKQICDVDMENCKNYLVTFLSEVSRGELKDETEVQRFWEEYEHYSAKGGNSYIKQRVEALKAKKML